MQLPTQPNQTPKSLYNPSKEDFTARWDSKDVKTLHAGEIETYPTWLANHIARDLCHKLVMERGIKTNYEADFKEMMQQIEVNL